MVGEALSEEQKKKTPAFLLRRLFPGFLIARITKNLTTLSG
jgi:hypothetical protein